MTLLTEQIRALGVQSGDTLMVHASLRRVGGRADVLIDSLLEAVGAEGTLFAYADFETTPDLPHFDPARSPCAVDHGVFPEVLRRRPGTLRSTNPGASVLALGAQAHTLVDPHPLNYGYGLGTPFERFVSMGGTVLLLGSSLDAVTILHYAEAIADLPGKRVVHHALHGLEIEEFDTSEPVVTGMPENYFELIVRAFIGAHRVVPGMVGGAESYLLDAAALVRFAREKMEREYGGGT